MQQSHLTSGEEEREGRRRAVNALCHVLGHQSCGKMFVLTAEKFQPQTHVRNVYTDQYFLSQFIMSGLLSIVGGNIMNGVHVRYKMGS
jgi:hypothetical protein